MPDLFIPADTSGGSAYYGRVRAKSLIYRFALKYSDDNRSELDKLETPAEFADYLEREDIRSAFVNYASANGVKPSRQGLARSGEIIEIQLKAYIARNFLDNDGFYPIWQILFLRFLHN